MNNVSLHFIGNKVKFERGLIWKLVLKTLLLVLSSFKETIAFLRCCMSLFIQANVVNVDFCGRVKDLV